MTYCPRRGHQGPSGGTAIGVDAVLLVGVDFRAELAGRSRICASSGVVSPQMTWASMKSARRGALSWPPSIHADACMRRFAGTEGSHESAPGQGDRITNPEGTAERLKNPARST